MVDESAAPDESHRKLLDDLERISATLESEPLPLVPDPADIPVLIDIVSIPILADKAEPEPPAAPDDGNQDLFPRDSLRAELEIESAFIVDDLVDEFLPQLEAVLRKRLEERRQQLLSADDDEPDTDSA